MDLWAAFSLALPFRTPIAIWNINAAYLFNANSALQAPFYSKHWVSVILCYFTLFSKKKCDWPFKVCIQCGVPKEMAATLAVIAVRPAPWVSQGLPERCVWLSHRLLSAHSEIIITTCRSEVYSVQWVADLFLSIFLHRADSQQGLHFLTILCSKHHPTTVAFACP